MNIPLSRPARRLCSAVAITFLVLAFAVLNVSVRAQLNGASAWTYLQPKSWISGHGPVGSVNLSPQSPGSDNTKYLSFNRASLGALSAFLLEHGLTTHQTIFVSFGCAKTIHALLNFKLALDLFNLGNDYVILCLDTVCTDVANANGILSYDGFASEKVNARTKELSQPGRKFAASLDLLEGGYNFVFSDEAVYLTGNHHPLSAMRPLEDETWDIQFQSDESDDQMWTRIHTGWYWARSSDRARQYFIRCLERWEQWHEQEQWVMNRVRWDMAGEGVLNFPHSVVLSDFDYRNSRLNDWNQVLTNTELIDTTNRDAVLMHYTLIFDALKIYVAKHLGHWLNATYYTHTPLLLRPVGIQGTVIEIRRQMDFAINVAKHCGRTFMFPHLVNQNMGNNEWREAVAHWTVNVEDIIETVPWVEATFLHNRRKHTSENIIEGTMSGDHNKSEIASAQAVFNACLSSDVTLLNLDLSGWNS